MITTLLVLAIGQLSHAGQAAGPADRFIDAMARSSNASRALATTMQPANETVVNRSKLNAAALSHSEAWMNKVLVLSARKSAAKSSWSGRQSADGISKLFVRTWSSDLGTATWSDNGVFAVVRVHLAERARLSDRGSAEAFAEERLNELLDLPKVPTSSIEWYLKPGSADISPKLFEGNVFRGLRTEPIRLPNGVMAQKGLDPMKWHNVMFVASDGTDLVVRINFFGTDRTTLREVADPRTRF